jgi:pimeloyl-ACP methyl ester carboxylesterase
LTNTGRPALIFIHGAGANSDFWHWQQSAFPEAHYLNLPGHYKGSGARGQGSDSEDTASNPKSKFQNPKSIPAYADWVAQYVEDEGLESVVLNGHSMGGAITMTLALRQPAWLKAIILTGTGARLRVLPRLLELLRTDYPAAVDLIIQDSFAPPSEPLTYAQRARLNGTRRQSCAHTTGSDKG